MHARNRNDYQLRESNVGYDGRKQTEKLTKEDNNFYTDIPFI